jgi:tRNA(fMet)-specific endonuclease VapC
MKYMLDTDICIYLINSRSERVQANLMKHEGEGIAISAITQSELWFGVAKSGSPRNAAALRKFLDALVVLDFDADIAPLYGEVRSKLEKRGVSIGPLDTLIASHALSRDMTLVTNNVREFKRVSGLKAVSWA